MLNSIVWHSICMTYVVALKLYASKNRMSKFKSSQLLKGKCKNDDLSDLYQDFPQDRN